jgi:hypothetical protein
MRQRGQRLLRIRPVMGLTSAVSILGTQPERVADGASSHCERQNTSVLGFAKLCSEITR